MTFYKQTTNKSFGELVFDRHDVNKSGYISYEELKSICYDLGHYFTEEEMAMALCRLDSDGDGKLSLEEFKKWWRVYDRFSIFQLSPEKSKMLKDCINHFRYFDRNNNGFLEFEEYVQFHKNLIQNGYQKYLSDPIIDMETMDKNDDGLIRFNEYLNWLIDIGVLTTQQ